MKNENFVWDWDAQEVRNSDRSIWMRRAERREGMNGLGVRPEIYGIFQVDFSIGFFSSVLSDVPTEQTQDLWPRTDDQRAITTIVGLSDVVRFDPILERREELGPFKPTHSRFQSLEQQEHLMAAFKEMLGVLPESFNSKEKHAARAAGRVGYQLELTNKLSNELLAGALIQ